MKTLFLSSPTLKDRIVIDLKQTPAQLAETKKNPSMSANQGMYVQQLTSSHDQRRRRVLCWSHLLVSSKSPVGLKLISRVEGEIVSGLKYLQVVKRAGMTVDKTEAMLGSYGPQQEEYTKIVSPIWPGLIRLCLLPFLLSDHSILTPATVYIHRQELC
jgi:Rho GDP-dissociation inhibitor